MVLQETENDKEDDIRTLHYARTYNDKYENITKIRDIKDELLSRDYKYNDIKNDRVIYKKRNRFI